MRTHRSDDASKKFVFARFTPRVALPSSSNGRILSPQEHVSLNYKRSAPVVEVVEHHIVDDWRVGIGLEKDIGIDLFALYASIERRVLVLPSDGNAYLSSFASANARQPSSPTRTKPLRNRASRSSSYSTSRRAYWTNGTPARLTTDDRTTLVLHLRRVASVLPMKAAVCDGFDWGAVKNMVQHKIITIPNLQNSRSVRNSPTPIGGAFPWRAYPTNGGNTINPGPMTTQ